MSGPLDRLPDALRNARVFRMRERLPRELPPVATYHDRPVLKEPEWTWEVPWYLFFGGMAGAASLLAALEALAGREDTARWARRVAAVGAAASPPLLIADLGRPKRFYNMLRVFRPTSAMSVGSWTLGAYSTAAIGAVGADVLGLRGLRRVGDAGAGLLGIGMATYTGVLVADSSIPVWHEARRELPSLFAAGATASAAGVLQVLTPSPTTRRLALGAAGAELGVERAMHHRLGAIGEVYDDGDTGRWSKAAKACTVAGAALTALPPRLSQRMGGALIAAGALCQRWAVYRAGFASAADPRHLVAVQRWRRGEQETPTRAGAPPPAPRMHDRRAGVPPDGSSSG